MSQKRVLLIVLCVMVLASSLLSACGGSQTPEPAETVAQTKTEQAASSEPIAADENTDPFGKYEPAITITATAALLSNQKYPQGDDLYNNIWTRGWENDLGIKIKYLWTAPDTDQYRNKMNISLASNELPDIMPLQAQQYYLAVKGDRIQAIDTVIEKYATPGVKEILDMSYGYGKKAATVNGKIYGMFSPPDIPQNPELLWVRKDWLDNLGLPVPKTMDDVLKTAIAFATQDPDKNNKKDTFGLALQKNLIEGVSTLGGFFNGYHAYPNTWIEKDGQLVNGSTLPEMKVALQKLQDLFKAGAINREFGIKDSWNGDDYVANKYGMLYGYFWHPMWPLQNGRAAEPEGKKGDWIALPVMSADDQPALAQSKSKTSSFFAARKGFENPEALVKLVNYYYAKAFDVSPDNKMYDQKFHDVNDNGTYVETFLFNIWRLEEPGGNIKIQKIFKEAIEKNDASLVPASLKEQFDRIKSYISTKDEAGWADWRVFGPEGSMGVLDKVYLDKANYIDRNFGSDTPTMTEKGTSLYLKSLEYFAEIIMGADVNSKFNEWLDYWQNQGGSQITTEVNEWWKTAEK